MPRITHTKIGVRWRVWCGKGKCDYLGYRVAASKSEAVEKPCPRCGCWVMAVDMDAHKQKAAESKN